MSMYVRVESLPWLELFKCLNQCHELTGCDLDRYLHTADKQTQKRKDSVILISSISIIQDTCMFHIHDFISLKIYFSQVGWL